ncbi:DUF5605 domain-containing protein [Paenibacillus chartarius]|uniref:DUF5605 domain-containing protein n=1 Tax=Paenibacillus chartarius TaxID=747481 RepID=A0ABV6DDX9_9BACL
MNAQNAQNAPDTVPRFGLFELELEGPAQGNPYKDVRLGARFRSGPNYAEAEGFYDGDGIYRIRFMPCEEGEWTYVTESGCSSLDGIEGKFVCRAASPGEHGPVRVTNGVHFGHSDGTRYAPFGTTSLAWHLQSETLRSRTLQTLAEAPFNKLRMCVLPIAGGAGTDDFGLFPFEGSPQAGFDFTRFHPPYFAHLERCIKQLAELGIQAELILFHPYGDRRWGFDRMRAEDDDRYVRYVVARLAAFSNVWWSLACEYDLLEHKRSEDWRRLFRIIGEYDSGGHVRSISGRTTWYDTGLPWITHASLRHADVKVASDCTRQYGKPAIIDECGAEGNLPDRWGSLTPEELVMHVWEGTFRGGYVGHSESYEHPDGLLWRLHGGLLRGESVPRIAFLRRIVEEAPARMLYTSDSYDAATISVRGEYYLQYFGLHRFAFREFALPEGQYKVDVIDTWNMKVHELEGTFEGRFRIDLPGELYYALRIRRAEGAKQ